MKLERAKNAKRNIIFGMLSKSVTLVLPFIVRTVMIKVLGIEYLGLNSLFGSILQVLNLSELGFGSAIIYSMYKPIAENDARTICSLLNLYKKIYRIIGTVILLVGVCILPFLPKLVKGGYPEGINIYVLYLIYLSNTVVSYWLYAYKTSILHAFQRLDVVNCINIVIQGIMNILQMIVLITMHNYYIYLILMPLSSILNNLYASHFVKKMYPQYVCKGEVSDVLRRDIKVKVTGLMINKMCMMSRNSFDNIFVSVFLGLTVTAMYTNYYYVIEALIGVLSVIISSLLAGIGNSIVLETAEKNYTDMRRLNFVYMLISGWCTVCLICLYQPFMKIWVGEKLMFSFDIVVLFAIYFYALKMGDVRGLYSDAVGLWWENRYRAVLETVANVILNFVLVQMWGIYGIIIATLISLLIINFGYGSQILFRVYFKTGQIKEYFFDHIGYALVTLVVCAFTYWVCDFVHGEDWFVLVCRTLICCVLPIVMYVVVYCRTKKFNVAMKWLMNKLKINNNDC